MEGSADLASWAAGRQAGRLAAQLLFFRYPPQMYAPMSLIMTREQGRRNHMSPSKMLLTKKLEGMKTTSRIM